MSAADLMADLARLGIRIEAHGDRLRYCPRSAVTSDLADRMKAHKGELLANLRGEPEARAPNATERPEAEADDALDPAGLIDPPDPCPVCGGLEVWQAAAGDMFAQTPGRWRCLRCDPPTTARRVREPAARLRLARQIGPG